MAELSNLEEFVAPWVQVIYESDRPKLKLNDLHATYEWSHLHYNLHPTENKNFKSTPPGQMESNCLFKTSYDNETHTEQSYNFHVNRTTNSTMQISITKGYSFGASMKANYQVPGGVFSMGAEFKAEYSLSKSTNQTISETITWGADSSVKVPPHTRAVAELKVVETKANCEFTNRADVSGELKVIFTNPKDNNNYVTCICGDIATIMKYCMDKKKYSGDDIIIENGVVQFYTKGESKFSFGVEQKVKVTYEAL